MVSKAIIDSYKNAEILKQVPLGYMLTSDLHSSKAQLLKITAKIKLAALLQKLKTQKLTHLVSKSYSLANKVGFSKKFSTRRLELALPQRLNRKKLLNKQCATQLKILQECHLCTAKRGCG